MKRHEIIYALRAYAHHNWYKRLLEWDTEQLADLLKAFQNEKYEKVTTPTGFSFTFKVPWFDEDAKAKHARVLGTEDSWGIDKAVEGGDYTSIVIKNGKKLDKPWILSTKEMDTYFKHGIVPQRYQSGVQGPNAEVIP